VWAFQRFSRASLEVSRASLEVSRASLEVSRESLDVSQVPYNSQDDESPP
jgi:hypothetical protein